ncbi:Acyltransferase family protein [Pseudobutyrivibrio sp. 49]|uniref:acyltransferase family protein n=1 Tax=unclassified Pseudobutyrivibrio TaxID=2638619 RepID=UPI0008916610|nr:MULTISPECIES: acyltransferase family protein [unclassified Pseudobutyrivibrio]SDI50119.1 Acyltransferase family protein [Pseudobutyrivibrio sp. 49]SFO23337.1 Acyltransferase family protein [Pseudobutyrivibrio sp. UC1225]
MNNKSSRASNIELLRIVAMFMIISYHIILHCVNVQLVNVTSIEKLQNGWFNNPLFYKQLLALALMMPFGLVGNALFIMISGYFLTDREIDMLKISKKLLSQLLFAAVTLVLASSLFIWKYTQIDVNENLFSYIRIQYFNKMSWFVGYYFIIMLLAFCFLNKFLASLDRKKYLGFLFTILAISQLSWSGSLLDDLAKGLRTVVIGIFLYALGGYIKKYNPFDKVRGYIFFLVVILTNVLIGISYHNTVIGKIQSYYYNQTTTTVQVTDFTQSIPKFDNYSIVVVIIGVCIFELFRRINLPELRIINTLAKATFMIYLLHDNGFAYSIWQTQDWITLLYNDFWGFALKLFIWTASVFGIGLVAYWIFVLLSYVIKKSKWLYIKE